MCHVPLHGNRPTLAGFCIRSFRAHLRRTPAKALELPPEVAKAFVRDMRAFFAAGHQTIEADGIAARQLHALKQHYNGKLPLTDIKEMFVQMRDHAQTVNSLARALRLARWSRRLNDRDCGRAVDCSTLMLAMN
jgi:hypothetical protein